MAVSVWYRTLARVRTDFMKGNTNILGTFYRELYSEYNRQLNELLVKATLRHLIFMSVVKE